MKTQPCFWNKPGIVTHLLAVTCLLAGVHLTEASSGATKPEVPGSRLDLSDAPEAWLISTRRFPSSCPRDIGVEAFSYSVSRNDCPTWEVADADAFFQGPVAEKPVIVFVHGNRTDRCEAIREGWSLYRQLVAQSAGRPFRFVIWAWPADHLRGGPRRDAQIKAARSDAQSFYLAKWLDRLPPGASVTLVGYSFGARIICGALHLAEGGTLQGRTCSLEPSGQARQPVRVMLVAAALDCEWLLPGYRNGLATKPVDQMMITRNCCDRVLRLYPKMRRYDSSSALGYAGPASPGRLSESGLSLEVVPVESQVGRDHNWHTYLNSSAVRSRLAWYSHLVDESPSDKQAR